MVPSRDEWGHDPSVERMRRVFQAMEEAQEAFLREIGLSTLDVRLRRARENARSCFERVWPLALERGVTVGEKRAGLLYLHCLARALRTAGVRVPDKASLADESISRFLREVLP